MDGGERGPRLLREGEQTSEDALARSIELGKIGSLDVALDLHQLFRRSNQLE